MQNTHPLLKLPCPFPTEWGSVLLLEPDTADHDALCRQLLDGSYAKPFVIDDGTQRTLYFNLNLMQSAMSLATPETLVLRYTRQLMAFLLFLPRPQNIHMIGLGGGALVRFLHHYCPEIRLCVYEIDPEVIALRDAFMLPADGPGLSIVAADGAAAIAIAEHGIEVLIIDAFGPTGFAPIFADPVFLETAFDKLARNGLMVMNLAGERQDYERLIRTVAQVFDERVILMPVPEDGNDLLFAFRDPYFDPRWRAIEQRAPELRARYSLDFPAFAASLQRSAKSLLHRSGQPAQR